MKKSNVFKNINYVVSAFLIIVGLTVLPYGIALIVFGTLIIYTTININKEINQYQEEIRALKQQAVTNQNNYPYPQKTPYASIVVNANKTDNTESYSHTVTEHPVQNQSDNSLKKTKKKSSGCILPLICVAALFIAFIIGIELSTLDDNTRPVGNTTAKTTQTTTKVTTQKTTEPTTSKEDFISTCKEYKYSDIARNPDSYIDKNVKFTGKIIQVSNNTSLFGNYVNTTYRINVTKDEYGFYEDTVYVTYTVPEGSSKFLEDDIVTLYGVCNGEKSYISTLGATITIPEVNAKYMKLVKGN